MEGTVGWKMDRYNAIYYRVVTEPLWVIISRDAEAVQIRRVMSSWTWAVPEGEARAMVAAVVRGECPPDILADWIEDHIEGSPLPRLLRECEREGTNNLWG